MTNFVRLKDAPRYAPADHLGVTAFRLQGLEAGGPVGFWVGRSNYAPGATASQSPVAGDTVYLLLSGRLTVHVASTAGQGELVVDVVELDVGDSLFLPSGTLRSVSNPNASESELLVILQPRTAPQE